MTTSNIHKALHLNGKKLIAEDIHVGLQVYFPSGVGGIIKYKCTSLDVKQAVFISINKDWPGEAVIEFDQADLTLVEFEQLTEALKKYSSFRLQPSSQDRALVNRADTLGYVSLVSHTQAYWTELGVAKYKELK